MDLLLIWPKTEKLTSRMFEVASLDRP